MGADHHGVRCFACGRLCEEATGGPSADEVDQTRRWIVGVLDVHVEGSGCRAGVACWECVWRTDPDLWIRAEDWDALAPQVPSVQLPPLRAHDDGRWDAARYPWPGESEAAG